MPSVHNQNKVLITRLCAALYDYEPCEFKQTLKYIMAADCAVHWCHPFGDMIGPDALFDTVFADLCSAIPDLERRDYIRVAGESGDDCQWVGCAGYYTGVFTHSWLGIPATGHLITFRFHEFYRVADSQIVEVQAIWDIPDLLRQANRWPMAPSLGAEIHVPGPATNDGIVTTPYNVEQSAATRTHIIDMLTAMTRHPSEGGPEVMEMDRYWHPKMTWYGPSGIGTSRGIDGFREWHQKPFLAAMPDRGQYPDEVHHHFFADGHYAAVTGWPNMAQTITGDGWMGIVPTGKKIYLRSLDFWRLENSLIRENWVLVDLLDIYAQLGVDVLNRARQLR